MSDKTAVATGPSVMGPSVKLNDIMPAMIKHAGIWEGLYLHMDMAGNIVDQHTSRVECLFPTTGPYAYIQKNHFTWADGRTYRAELQGTLRDGKLWWDNETFSGCAWESEFGLILLNLDRKDDPGANFFEIIALGNSGRDRARTWHWFKDGKPFKRTLCDEKKVSS